MNDTYKSVAVVLIIMGSLFGASFAIVEVIDDDEKEVYYNYHIKTEQVEQSKTVTESVNFANLSADEREILYKAFKKSDHFLGGASATVEQTKQFDTFNEWRVIRIKGVPLLVAISEERVVDPPMSLFMHIILSMPLTLIILMWLSMIFDR